MNVGRKNYYSISNLLGLSEYKMSFFRKKILYGMYKRQGLKGARHFMRNFQQINYTKSEAADTASMFLKLHIEITTGCNFSCKMCSRRQLTEGPENMGFDSFKMIVDKLPGLVDVQFTGLGETLFNPDFLRMAEYLRSRYILFGISTNGSLLTDLTARRILESGVDWVSVSLHAMDQRRYEAITGHHDLQGVLGRIQRFQFYKKRFNGKVFSELVFVYTEENKEELSGVVGFAFSAGFNRVRVKIAEDWNPKSCPSRAGEPEGASQVVTADQWRIIDAAIKQARGLGIKFNVTTQTRDLQHRRSSKQYAKKCESPWYHISVLYNGDVVPCCLVGAFHRKYIVGNLIRDDFSGIWNNSKYLLFRKMHLTGEPPDMCNYCARAVAPIQ